MSNLSRIKQIVIVLILLSVLVTFYVRAAESGVELTIDPTAPLITTKASSGASLDGAQFLDGLLDAFRGFQLNSILIRKDDRIAVINAERVRIGDKVGNAVVTGIEPNEVTLNVDGETEVLSLYNNTVRIPVAGEN